MSQITVQKFNFFLARLSAFFVGAFVVSIFLYGAFMLMAVAHTSSRTEAERQIQVLTANLGTLEEQYLAETKNLTLEHATELGFVPLPQAEVATVYASGITHALTLKTGN